MESTIFATIVGALVGSLLTVFTTRLQKNYELRLSLREKILDRRINAHERIIDKANSMIAMQPLQYLADDGKLKTMTDYENEIMRSPHAFQSKQVFTEFQSDWARVNGENSHWLSIELVRELYLFQDYLMNLRQLLEGLEDSQLLIVGDFVRQDFIDFSSSIRALAYEYFYSDLERMELEEGNHWHKYEWAETIKRLKETRLFKESKSLMKILNMS